MIVPLIPVLKVQRQEDLCEFGITLVYKEFQISQNNTISNLKKEKEKEEKKAQ